LRKLRKGEKEKEEKRCNILIREIRMPREAEKD